MYKRQVWNEKCSSRNLVLHSDNGGPMRSCTLLAKMYALGVLSSYSRPLVSNDNPYSESLFRTIKYCPWWPENGFRTIDEARSWLSRFTRWYNLEHKPAVLSMLLRMNAIAELMHKYWKPEKSLSRSSQTSSWALEQTVAWLGTHSGSLSESRKRSGITVILLHQATTTLKNAVTHRSPSR